MCRWQWLHLAAVVRLTPAVADSPLLLLLLHTVPQAGTESAQAPQLYTVLEQRKAAVGGGLLGTDHVYVMPGAEGAAGAGAKRRWAAGMFAVAVRGGLGYLAETTCCMSVTAHMCWYMLPAPVSVC